jgi:hypothetical protein
LTADDPRAIVADHLFGPDASRTRPTRSEAVYADYAGSYRTRFEWVRSELFTKALAAT